MIRSPALFGCGAFTRSRAIIRTTVLTAFLATFLVRSAIAQETNREILEELAIQCLAATPRTAGVDSLHLASPESYPYLRAAIVTSMIADGVLVVGAERSQSDPDVPTLRFEVEHAEVRYSRMPGRRLGRSVSLALQYTFVRKNGTVVADGVCSDEHSDVLPSRDHTVVEDPAFPETVGTPPAAGWVRRYLEPAVLVGATAIGVLLFFSLRS